MVNIRILQKKPKNIKQHKKGHNNTNFETQLLKNSILFLFEYLVFIYIHIKSNYKVWRARVIFKKPDLVLFKDDK